MRVPLICRSRGIAPGRRLVKDSYAFDGAASIDLIDGEQSCELLKEHRLGVRTTLRQVEDVEVLAPFFEQLSYWREGRPIEAGYRPGPAWHSWDSPQPGRPSQ